MTAGDKYQYLWCDGVLMKKPTAVSAPRYVDLLLTWVESQLNDEAVFPIRFDAPFPKRFKEAVCSPSTAASRASTRTSTTRTTRPSSPWAQRRTSTRA